MRTTTWKNRTFNCHWVDFYQTYVNSSLQFVLRNSASVTKHLSADVFANSRCSVQLKQIN